MDSRWVYNNYKYAVNLFADVQRNILKLLTIKTSILN